MASNVDAEPLFVALAKSEAVTDQDKVRLYFLDRDRGGYIISVATGVVPNLMTELTARLQQLRPDGPSTAVRPIRVREIALAMADDGTPAMLLKMDGYKLAIELTQADLRTLHSEIGQLLVKN